MSFLKFDKGKPRYDLLLPEFEEECAKVLALGAEKYGDNNWQKAEKDEALARYYAALRRHIGAFRRGERLDPETGLHHLAHAFCNLQFLYYFDSCTRSDSGGVLTDANRILGETAPVDSPGTEPSR